jgi:hypothetical protein
VSLLAFSDPPKYKLLIFEYVKLVDVISLLILKLVDLENFLIFSKADVSLDIELLTCEKSMLLREEALLFGDSIRWLGRLL